MQFSFELICYDIEFIQRIIVYEKFRKVLQKMQISHLGYNPSYSQEAPSLEQIESLTGEALLEFGVPWCPHCQLAMKAIEEVLSELSFKDLPHIKILDGKGKPLGRSFKVKRWPTLIWLRDGKEVARIERPLRASDMRLLMQG